MPPVPKHLKLILLKVIGGSWKCKWNESTCFFWWECSEYILDLVEINDIQENWFQRLKIVDCNKLVTCKLDTGVQVNVIPEYIFKKLDLKKLEKVNLNCLRW